MLAQFHFPPSNGNVETATLCHYFSFRKTVSQNFSFFISKEKKNLSGLISLLCKRKMAKTMLDQNGAHSM